MKLRILSSASALAGHIWTHMDINMSIYVQTLKDSQGQIEAWGRSVCGPETGRGCFDTHARMVSRETVSESIPETGAEAPQATRRAREVL